MRTLPRTYRRLVLASVVAVLTAIAAAPLPARAADAPPAAAKRPNVVIFLADDLGWGDIGPNGNPRAKTPNLDAFAKQGVRLTQCYSAGSVCSPSRSAILTGRTPYRNGVFDWIPDGTEFHLRTSEIALPKLLKGAGYQTCHVGKWHLNGKFNSPEQPQPSDHGYDHWLATQNNAAPSHAHPTNFVRNGKEVGKVEDYSAPFIATEAAAWLKEKRDPAKPFFLTVWSHEPHYPIAAAERFKAMHADEPDPVTREYLADVTQMDHAFGAVLKVLDELKAADDTLVIFTSDNGPEGDGVKTPGRGTTGGLRGRKRSLYDGGVRVPGLVRWPGQVAGGTTSDVPVIGSDWFATVLAAAGVKGPTDRVIDGADARPAFEGLPVARQRPMYWRWWPQAAMRDGDYKIVAKVTPDGLANFELYNLSADRAEKNNLAAAEPDRLAKMREALLKLHAEVEAEGPDWWKRGTKPRNLDPEGGLPATRPATRPAGKRQPAAGGK